MKKINKKNYLQNKNNMLLYRLCEKVNVLKGIKIAVIGGIMSLVVAGSAFASSKQFGNVQARWEGDTGVVYVYSYVEDIKKDGVSWDAYVWVKDSYGETVYTEGTTRGCGTKVEASKAKTINPFDSNKAGYRYVKEHK